MASPDSTRKIIVWYDSVAMAGAEPAAATIIHALTNTTIVRIAVATVLSVFLIPHLDKIAVIPANTADNPANTTHKAIIDLTNLRFVLPLLYNKGFKK